MASNEKLSAVSNTNKEMRYTVLPERMPAIPPEKMSDAQRKAVADLVATRGVLKGPFMAIMRCPDLMDRIQRVGEYIRYKGALDLRINRMAGLMMTRYWSNQYEWHGNIPYALKAGLDPAIIQAIGEGRRPASMADDETIVHEFMTELLTNKSVSDPTYERAVAKFGEDGIIELLGIVGYYGMLAMIMNVVRTPVPDGDPLSLAPMPEQIKPVL
jgi:4-carboxymuconolactone decarboxylase